MERMRQRRNAKVLYFCVLHFNRKNLIATLNPGGLGSCIRGTQFTCTSGECISSSWKCDGNFDCEDGSDEAAALCSPETNSTTYKVACDVEQGSFLCDDGKLCLDSSQVCFLS